MSAQPYERTVLLSQLALLLQQAAETSRRLNLLSNVAVLNSDVLLKIFRFLCPDPPSEHKILQARRNSRTQHPTTDVRHVSQVCHEWRQVAIQSPSIWGAILDCSVEPVNWLLELIQRSKGSPVNIVSDLGHGKSTLLAISPKLRVVGSITLFYGWRPSFEEIFNALSKTLQNDTAINIFGASTASLPPKILPLTFKPRALKLCTLGTDLTHQCFTKLQDLSIATPSTAFNSSEWVRILRGFPQLIHLRLDRAVDNTHTPTTSSLTPFSLPRLQSFTISCDLSQSGVGQLLSCFVPSQPYALRLNSNLVPLSGQADLFLPGVEKWSSAWLQGASAAAINRKVHIISSGRKISIHNVDMPDNHSFNITFKWAGRDHDREISKIEAKVLQTMQPVLQCAHELQITPDWKLGRSAICPSRIWEGFTSVRTLCFSNHPDAEDRNQGLLVFLDALINDLVRSSDIPLPNLKCLSLKRLSNLGEHLVTAKLETLLARSRANGWELEELQVHQSSVAIGESLRRKFGRLLTVSVFSAHNPLLGLQHLSL
ncbi:hypothetical protein CPB83DRAFT_831834 [Crepidotus variabilis]|uniref:F-box domain-containing protein n=1 Tax=Crepidotus variabilis TaxID=179855 RepID=A0A9P6JW18_9AGAR|nr:hypothetical protein CPB83DRAFT_831834 [Crepidotus variabilis]